MNVCFVLISTEWGGGENVVHQMISKLIENDVNVLLILNHEILKYFNDLEIEIFDLGSLFDTKSLFKMLIDPEQNIISSQSRAIKFFHLPLMFLYFYRIRSLIKDYCSSKKIDLLHSHIEYSDVLCYIIQKGGNNKTKWVSDIHGPWFSLFFSQSNLSSVSNFFIIRFLKKAFQKMDKIIFVSKYLYIESLKIFKEVISEKGLVIHNGITLYPDNNSDDNRGILRADDSSPKFLKKGFNILFPGGPKLKKGGDILIESIKLIINDIPDLNLYIALDVPSDHIIRKLVADYNLEDHVNFVGFLKPQKYMELLSSVDILAMPSRMEPFGMVYLEAMALGVPIIASDVGGGAEIIQNGRNGLINPPQPKYVAKSILKLYNDVNLRQTISKNNLEDIHQFDWDHLIQKYIRSYEEVINM